MKVKRTYKDEDKAFVLATLRGNGGNVSRTSRETGIALQTIRDWKKLQESGKTKPGVRNAIPAAVDKAVVNWERVRNKALESVEKHLDDGKVNAVQSITVFGVLTDKIRLMRGEATSRTETIHGGGATPQEIGSAIGAALESAFGALSKRKTEILEIEDNRNTINAEYVELLPEGLSDPSNFLA